LPCVLISAEVSAVVLEEPLIKFIVFESSDRIGLYSDNLLEKI